MCRGSIGSQGHDAMSQQTSNRRKADKRKGEQTMKKTIEELKKDAIEMLENDDELFVDMVKRARRIQRLR